MTAEKTSKATTVQHQAASGTFFRKAEEPGFFGNHETPSFFGSAPIQAKLTVSQPDDPQEKEADAVADQVMRMPEPTAAAGTIQPQEEGTGIMRLPEAAETPITAPTDDEHRLDRKEEGDGISIQPLIMRKCAACEHEEHAQAKLMRMSDEDAEGAPAAGINEVASEASHISPKAHGPPAASLIQRSGRAPPAHSHSFESALEGTKGGGMPLPADTRHSMEGRFGADFSGVRVHTGTQAESLSADIHAHAFTHGGDIYFNSGKFSPDTAEGSRLLAHELTHTIQQGASRPVQGQIVAPKLQSPNPNPQTMGLQRAAAERPSPPQLTAAVAKAKGEEGKVNANKEGPDGFRTGWESLIDYFKTTLGPDKVVGAGGSYQKGAVAEQDIKKKREITGALPPAHPAVERKGPYKRDAMPSWCGIFVFWALHKAGVPMKAWELGGRNITPDAAFPPGHTPQAGDIAYRNNFSHFAIVEKASGNTVTTVNGNTAGEDNLGGQVQTRDHPRSDWTAFFDPLMLKDGPLSSGETNAETTKPLTTRELRKKLFHVDRKREGSDEELSENASLENEHTESSAATTVQSKPELSSLSINASGALQRNAEPQAEEDKLQRQEEDKQEDEKVGGQAELSIQKKAEGRHSESLTANAESAVNSISLNSGLSSTAYAKPQPSNSKLQTLQPKLQANKGPPGLIQRSWLGDAWDAVSDTVSSAVEWAEDHINEAKEWILEQIRDFVVNIPGYRLLTVILQEDPITGAAVERNGTNLLLAGLQILGPLGSIIETLLRRTDTFTEAANFVEGRIDDFAATASSISGRFSSFIDGLSVTDIGNPQQVLDDVAALLHGVITDITGFVQRTTQDFLAMVKRVMIREVVGFVRRRIPRLYPLLTVVLGHDPVTDVDVPRNGTNILNALFEVTDEGREQRRQLQETGTFQKVAAWIDRGIHVFTGLYTAIRAGFTLIWEAVSFETLLHPVETFENIYNHFAQPIADVWAFVRDTARIIIDFIKEALLGRLSRWARDQRGYFLITLLIRRDPFTGASVPFTIENVIHAFMSLMEGGEQQFQQMKESGAIDRTTNRILAAVRRLNFTVEYIVGLFMGLWRSFRLSDLANPIGVFQRIIATFGGPVRRLIAFVVEIIKIVVEVILQIMQFPTDLIANILARAMAAWERIKSDPIGFLKNLLRAIKQGFVQFFDNVVDHLLHGLTGWLMSELRDAGVPELTDFSLRGVISWILQVLGLSMEAIWQKLAQHPRIGPERVARIRRFIGYAEGIWSFIKDVQERGITAIWEKIQEQLSNLWNTVLDAVKNWVMERIVSQVTARLLSMLDPTGIMAVINSAIAIYRAIQSFVRYLRQMLEVVNSFVEGLADIASGNIRTAANYLEGTMRRAMPIVIGFLANQVGLSGIGRRIGEMVGRVREMVDAALTWLVNKAVDTGFAIFERLMAMGATARDTVLGWLGLRKTYTSNTGANHTMYFRGTGTAATLILESTPTPIDAFLTNKLSEVNASTALDDAAKQQLRDKITLATQKKDELHALINPPGGNAPANAETLISQKMEEVKNAVKDLDISGGSQVVPTALYNPGFNNSRASTMDVKYVFNGPGNHDDGQPANLYSGTLSGALPVLDAAGLRSIWVAYHVVNADLGGKAVDSNLIPTPRLINGEYYRAFESPLKTIYRANKPIWMMAIVNYRSDFPDFPSEFQATGGGMKFENNAWVPDPTNNVPAFNKRIDPPMPEEVMINHLPAAEADWYLIVNLTPIARPVLRIVRDHKGGTTLTGKPQLKALIDAHAGSYGYDAGYISNMKNRVDEANINFAP